MKLEGNTFHPTSRGRNCAKGPGEDGFMEWILQSWGVGGRKGDSFIMGADRPFMVSLSAGKPSATALC